MGLFPKKRNQIFPPHPPRAVLVVAVAQVQALALLQPSASVHFTAGPEYRGGELGFKPT